MTLRRTGSADSSRTCTSGLQSGIPQNAAIRIPKRSSPRSSSCRTVPGCHEPTFGIAGPSGTSPELPGLPYLRTSVGLTYGEECMYGPGSSMTPSQPLARHRAGTHAFALADRRSRVRQDREPEAERRNRPRGRRDPAVGGADLGHGLARTFLAEHGETVVDLEPT